MKYISIIALLLASTSAHKAKFFDIPAEENSSAVEEAKKLNKADIDILSQIDSKMEQAQRNAAQGELGRTLAMSKINEIKLAFAQVKDNFVKETQQAVSDGTSPQAAEEEDIFSVAQKPQYTLEKKQKNIRELEKKAKQFEKRMPVVHDIEIELGLPDNVEDSELTSIKTSMEKALSDANTKIRDQQIQEAKAAQAAKPKEEEEQPLVRPNE